MDTMTQAFEEATQQIAALGNSLIIIVVALSIVPYILFAIGLGSVARTCRIRHSWMATDCKETSANRNRRLAQSSGWKAQKTDRSI